MTMSERKITVNFSSTTLARQFAQNVRKLPGVTYATDFCKGYGRFAVSIWGDWDEETEKKIKSKKI